MAATPCAGARAGEGATGKREGFAFGSSCWSPGSSGSLCVTTVDAHWDCRRSGWDVEGRGHLVALVALVALVLRLRNMPGL